MKINLKNRPKKLFWILWLSAIATFNAIYLTIWAYSSKAVVKVFWSENVSSYTASPSFCDINSTFSCSWVFAEDFAWFFGIPFSLIAAIVYPTIIIITLLWILGKIKSHYKILFFIALWWLAFNSYIIINEIIVNTYCILCLICTLIIITIWILAKVWDCGERNKSVLSKIKWFFNNK
jgi:uncharacterized membrane protein